MAEFTLSIATASIKESNAVVISKFEAGNEQRRLDHPEAANSWNIKASASTETDMQAYRAFYRARHGAFESFTWTPPGESSAVTVRFEGTLNVEDQLGYYDISFTFQKVVS